MNRLVHGIWTRRLLTCGSVLLVAVVVVWLGMSLSSPARPDEENKNSGGVGDRAVYRDSVSQYGITWTFDRSYPSGQFANGDYWVLGPVQIVAMAPSATPGRNGWMVNPVGFTQAYDDRTQVNGVSPVYNAALQPTLPYVANPGSSVIKAISVNQTSATCRPCLKTAAVLTVVGSVPSENGKNTFRPPYFGIVKPMISAAGMRLRLLPSLAPPKPESPIQPLSVLTDRFKRVQLDHVLPTWLGDNMHPVDNMPNYGASIGRDTGDAALRLMLNEPLRTKLPALIAYVQYGIDTYYTWLGGMKWQGDGGHDSGRKLPIVFAAVLLNDPAMKSAVGGNVAMKSFGEDAQVYFSSRANGGSGQILWGAECTEAQYWTKITTEVGRRDCRDPYGYVDGGSAEIGQAYQFCCTSKMWKGTALALHLMPALGVIWNNPYFLSYVDRWVNFGVWAQPDSCMLEASPTLNGVCLPGSGRFLSKHGTSKDSGFYDSPFADSMWRTYR
ncbi:MAG: hypothetical protein ACRDSR_01175 [Pseudonocardiaceae bacterium]